ncbi:MAG TPA: hypothetical protein VIG51_11760 [Candidatus Baltobacteraceae bacterium]|jgi:hypothetical protein
MKLALTSGGSVRSVWILAFLVLAGGYCAVNVRYQPAIGASAMATQRLYERSDSNERLVRDSGRLRSVQSRVARDIGRVNNASGQAAAISAFLMELHTLGARYGVRIVAVEPTGVQAPGAISGPPATVRSPLTGSDVRVRVRAHFRNLLLFERNLPRRGVLLAVHDTQMTLAAGSEQTQTSPLLEAVIRATLYRLFVSTPTAPLGGR